MNYNSLNSLNDYVKFINLSRIFLFMKKIIRKYSFLFFLLLLTASCSSSDDSVSMPAPPSVDDVTVEILSAEDITTEELMATLFPEDGGDMAAMRPMFVEKLKNQTQEIEKQLGVKGITLGYRRVKYLYSSTDHLGNQVTLSSVLYWNRYKLDGWHDIIPENICLVEHYTITSDAEAPTNSYPVEPHITGNSLVVMPDYLGYGHTAKEFHPYLNYDLAAKNSMDALKAAYIICNNHNEELLSGSWSLCVLGASQGGSNALAVHKYLDTNPSVAKEWRFSHSCCAAGAYSLATTFETYMRWGSLDYPVVLPMVLKSMLASYPDIMSGWSEEDFYSDDYLAIKPQIDAMLESKKHTTNEINAVFFENLADETGKLRVERIFSPEAMDVNSSMSKALAICFAENDLTKGWKPVHPVKFYHSKDDNVVPYENVEAAIASFGTIATLQAAEELDHTSSCAMWMLSIFMGGL